MNCIAALIDSLTPGHGALIYGPVNVGTVRQYATGRASVATGLQEAWAGAACHVFKAPLPDNYVPQRVTYCPAVSAKLTLYDTLRNVFPC